MRDFVDKGSGGWGSCAEGGGERTLVGALGHPIMARPMSAQEEALAADRQMGKAVCKVCDAVCVPVEDCLYKAPAGETCCGAPARSALLALGGVLGLLQLLDLLQFDVSLGGTPAMLSYDPYELWTDVLTAAFFVGGSYSVYAEDKNLASPVVVSPTEMSSLPSPPVT